jgi:nucleotide-binding universal stress UspA family protein
MYEHLLVALDGSEAAERVLPHVEGLAEAFHSKVTVLSAVVSLEALVAQSSMSGPGDSASLAPPVDATELLEAEQSGTTDYLSRIVARLRARGLSVETDTPEGDPAEQIVARADALGASLILMTTHGRGGIGRLVFGSTAEKVLRHATCPVLLVRIH